MTEIDRYLCMYVRILVCVSIMHDECARECISERKSASVPSTMHCNPNPLAAPPSQHD